MEVRSELQPLIAPCTPALKNGIFRLVWQIGHYDRAASKAVQAVSSSSILKSGEFAAPRTIDSLATTEWMATSSSDRPAEGITSAPCRSA